MIHTYNTYIIHIIHNSSTKYWNYALNIWNYICVCVCKYTCDSENTLSHIWYFELH